MTATFAWWMHLAGLLAALGRSWKDFLPTAQASHACKHVLTIDIQL